MQTKINQALAIKGIAGGSKPVPMFKAMMDAQTIVNQLFEQYKQPSFAENWFVEKGTYEKGYEVDELVFSAEDFCNSLNIKDEKSLKAFLASILLETERDSYIKIVNIKTNKTIFKLVRTATSGLTRVA